MRKLVLAVLLLVAAVYGFRAWARRPLPELPAVLWTPAPFRGPTVRLSPGDSADQSLELRVLSEAPPIESPQTVPDDEVEVVPLPGVMHRVAVYLEWRKPIPPPGQLTAAAVHEWNLRTYRFTGRIEASGGVRWAEYARQPAVRPPVQPK